MRVFGGEARWRNIIERRDEGFWYGFY